VLPLFAMVCFKMLENNVTVVAARVSESRR
jgi:hypothetical protein